MDPAISVHSPPYPRIPPPSHEAGQWHCPGQTRQTRLLYSTFFSHHCPTRNHLQDTRKTVCPSYHRSCPLPWPLTPQSVWVPGRSWLFRRSCYPHPRSTPSSSCFLQSINSFPGHQRGFRQCLCKQVGKYSRQRRGLRLSGCLD